MKFSLHNNKTVTLVALATFFLIIGNVSTVEAAPVKTSSGKTCTIVGTAGNDVINGTSKNDVICGLGGNDTINAGSGNDIIDGGSGRDLINGQLGNDSVSGGTGNDLISGNEGNDRLLGDAGNDTINGDGGNDGLIGGDGTDVLAGADGQPEPEEKNLCARDEFDQITYCGFDNAAPWVESLELARTEVDATNSTQTVELTLRITDGLMGFDRTSSSCWVMYEEARIGEGVGHFTRISGDAIDGTYKCTVSIDAGSPNGRFGISLDLWDLIGNHSSFDQTKFGHNFYSEPIFNFENDFWITNVGRGDKDAPRITEPKLSAETLNTEKADQKITLTLTASDDFSGVKSVDCGIGHKQIEFNFYSKAYGTGDGKLVSGNSSKGTWSCTMLVPKHVGPGKWTITMSATDKTGKNYRLTSDPADSHLWLVDDIMAWFVPEPITSKAKNYFTQTGAGDDVPPVLKSIVISPAVVDSSSKNQTITATITFGPEPYGQVIFGDFNLMYVKTMAVTSNEGCLVAKTNRDKSLVYTCQVTLKRGSPKGAYEAQMLVYDSIGNRGDYRGNLCTGKWRDVGINQDIGPVGTLGIYNKDSKDTASPNLAENCSTN